MPVKNIPDDNHVARHCKNRLVIRVDGRVRGVFPGLFHLRPANPPMRPHPEDYLSALWLEMFPGELSEKLDCCCSALSFKPKKQDVMVVLSVARIKEQGRKRGRSLRVTHEPKKHCPAYAAVRNVPSEPDDELAKLIAELAVVEAVEISAIISNQR